jgi:hypothetical protein
VIAGILSKPHPFEDGAFFGFNFQLLIGLVRGDVNVRSFPLAQSRLGHGSMALSDLFHDGFDNLNLVGRGSMRCTGNRLVVFVGGRNDGGFPVVFM